MEKLVKERKKRDRTAYSKKYREENKEKIKEYYKASQERIKVYREENKERIAAQQKAYQADNREEINAASRRYYAKNKDRYKKYHRKYTTGLPCGVYKIESISDPSKVYVGGSNQVPKRWWQHLSKLKHGKHENARLQAHYDEFGKNDLVFSTLILCDEADLIPTEQAYLDKLKPYFNYAPTAGSSLGIKVTDEFREKMRKIVTERRALEKRATAEVMPDRIFDTVLTIVA